MAFQRARFLTALVGLILCHTVCAADTFYVAKDGHDSQSGSPDAPWRTIQRGIHALDAGDMLIVREGIYSESLVIDASGNAIDGAITIVGENAVLDFQDVPVESGDQAAILMDSQAYVTIQGFEIRNLIATQADAVPIGIFLQGACHHIQILENLIHHIENDINDRSNAHGIAVYGTGTTAATSIHDLVISGNELHSLKLGASECMVVNGNVEDFLISDNLIHHCNNIGIDAIGFEQVSAGNFDQARNGIIRDNVVFQIDSRGNPAYGQDRSAGGIYVDGGKEILIQGNTISQCNIGIELASEHRGRATSLITVRSNNVHDCHIAGLAMGGFDKKRGSTQQCTIEDNLFRENDTDREGNGELWLQFQVRDNVIRHNVFWATSQNILMSNPFKTTSGNTIDFNTYFAPGGSENSTWEWKNKAHSTFSKYKKKSKNDLHSVFQNPELP